MYISDFHIIRPPFEETQEKGFSWLIDAHGKFSTPQKIKAALTKVGCRKEHIQKRGYSLSDFKKPWNKEGLYNLGFKARSQFFKAEVEKLFQKFYQKKVSPPDDLIHVTCTGYVSPSGAQKLVANKNWEKKTVVTHAYHMGCMAAIPAMRMASSFLNHKEKTKIDIVHTEMCALHINPSINTIEQLIAETLFADGFIKYSLTKKKKGFELISIHEEIIPETVEAMRWECEDWGMKMSLSKTIPEAIFNNIIPFVKTLLKRGEIKIPLKEIIFAIHPGGPKIIEAVVKALSLTEEKILETKEIFSNYGNMSSATVPHILEAILKNPKRKKGSIVVALAFGPGVTLSGVVLEKV